MIINCGSQEELGNRASPRIIWIPDAVQNPSREKAQQFIDLALSVAGPSHCPTILCEHDIPHSPEISAMFGAVDWNSVEEIGRALPTTAEDAYENVTIVGAAVPELEPVIADDPFSAFRYACDFVGAFPAGEQAIAQSTVLSVEYTQEIGVRIKPAEDSLAQNEGAAFAYGKAMRVHKLWASWTAEEVARSPVWMYQYAKDHMRGRLPDPLHNKMVLLHTLDSSNKWTGKYCRAKRYMLSKKSP